MLTMTTFMSETSGYLLLIGFAATMILVTCVYAHWRGARTRESFLAAGRNVRWWIGGPSIAAAWVWAGALFVSIQMAYEKGLPGIFWFTFPNIIALLVFIFLGPRIRKSFINGFTLPQFVAYRLQSRAVHNVFLIPFFFGQLVAVTFNIAAGGHLVHLLTGIPVTFVMPILALTALTYTLIAGLQASIVTDVVQMGLIVLAILVVIPAAVLSGGGWAAVSGGLSGVSGNFGNIFDPGVAFSFGIVTSIGLISQTISDQMYWQRAFAMRQKEIVKAFVFGAFLFALVPLSFSLLGFMAANPAMHVVLPAGSDPALIGVLTVKTFLPGFMVALFVVALLSGLCSTVDSALSATSSLWSTDVARHSPAQRAALNQRSIGAELSLDEQVLLAGMDKNIVRQSRLAMVVLTLVGLGCGYATQMITGFGIKQLFLLSISMAASISVPIVLTLYWPRLSSRGVFWGVATAVVIGMPLFFYADAINNVGLTVAASVAMLGISTAFCLALPRGRAHADPLLSVAVDTRSGR